MAGKMASISEENSKISDFEGFTEEDLAVNISVVPDSGPDSSDIKVSSVGSSDISDFGESEDENVENLNANAPNSGQPIFGMLQLIHLNKTVAQIYLKILMHLLLHH